MSVRTLQYYDEIGLFHPTKLTAAGYRYMITKH
ncbi:MerR family DNA-binding transcriptional regulator [Absiella sp. AM54-8XD]|nr:MerR family DNA-binding transcriptional regulator [Absiella sp. AM54-8XD]